VVGGADTIKVSLSDFRGVDLANLIETIYLFPKSCRDGKITSDSVYYTD